MPKSRSTIPKKRKTTAPAAVPEESVPKVPKVPEVPVEKKVKTEVKTDVMLEVPVPIPEEPVPEIPEVPEVPVEKKVKLEVPEVEVKTKTSDADMKKLRLQLVRQPHYVELFSQNFLKKRLKVWKWYVYFCKEYNVAYPSRKTEAARKLIDDLCDTINMTAFHDLVSISIVIQEALKHAARKTMNWSDIEFFEQSELMWSSFFASKCQVSEEEYKDLSIAAEPTRRLLRTLLPDTKFCGTKRNGDNMFDWINKLLIRQVFMSIVRHMETYMYLQCC
jgi:hypothetical protein